MRTLIAGANGFVGINLALRLLEGGHDVLLTYRSRFPEEFKGFLAKYGDRVAYGQGDLLDKNMYAQFDQYEIEGIINSAVMTSPDAAEQDYFISMAETNVMSNLNLLAYAAKRGIKRFVYVSSSGVYGDIGEPGTFVYEDGELDLFNTYCITKMTSERLTSKYGELFGAHVASARIAAPYGQFERVTGSRFKMSALYTMVHKAKAGEEVVIYGEDYRRDWTYVDDTVEGIYRLYTAEKLSDTVYNVSFAQSATIKEVAEAVKLANPNFKYRFTNNPEEADIVMDLDNQRGDLSVDRICKDTGFEPRFDVKAGIKKYVDIVNSGVDNG